MAIPRNLGNLAQGADSSGVLGTTKGGTGLTTVGTNGQVLQSNGSALVFATPSGGATVLISTQTASNSASLSWTGLTGYNNYMLVFNAIRNVNDATTNLVQVGTGAGPTYTTSSYTAAPGLRIPAGLTILEENSSSGVKMADESVNTGSVTYLSGQLSLCNFTNTQPFVATGAAVYFRDARYITQFIAGSLSTGSVYTAIRIIATSGNISSGTASLYGITS